MTNPGTSAKKKDKISKSGESIVCLPNRLSVTVEGEKKKEVDVIL